MPLAPALDMDASQALSLMQPLIEATQDMKRRKVSKCRCDELLLTVNALPLGVFEQHGQDIERLWMQALSSFRYALLLWLYGDFQTARDEAEKARWKVEQIRERVRPPEPRLAAEPSRGLVQAH